LVAEAQRAGDHRSLASVGLQRLKVAEAQRAPTFTLVPAGKSRLHTGVPADKKGDHWSLASIGLQRLKVAEAQRA